MQTRARFMESFEDIAQSVNQRTDFFFLDIRFFLEDIALLCLLIANLKEVECEKSFVGAFANTYYSVLGLENAYVVVKTTIYVSFISNFLWCVFVNWK